MMESCPGLPAFVLVLLQVLTTVLACSPTEEDIWSVPDTQKAHRYENILYGKVVDTFPDSRFDYGGGSDVYTAKMKIYCTYKGGAVQAVVNISEAGMYINPCKCLLTFYSVNKAM